MWISSFPSTICWRCCFFFLLCSFCHLCQVWDDSNMHTFGSSILFHWSTCLLLEWVWHVTVSLMFSNRLADVNGHLLSFVLRLSLWCTWHCFLVSGKCCFFYTLWQTFRFDCWLNKDRALDFNQKTFIMNIFFKHFLIVLWHNARNSIGFKNVSFDGCGHACL